MAKGKPVMVSFINDHGAVHTVAEELYLSQYKGTVKKLSKAALDKLGKLSDTVAALASVRANAVNKDGNPDGEARAKAAREGQAAINAEKKFRMSLIEED